MQFRVRAGEVDLERREVRRGDEVLVLSTIEAELLGWLLPRAGQVATRDELLVEVWGFPKPVVTRAVDNTVMRLRRKIELDPADPDHLRTLRGVGYVFSPLAVDAPASSEPVRASGLPAATARGPFFGRHRELDALATAAGRGRCVTLLGPGGVGKTRLVMQWAASLPAATVCGLAAARSASDVRQALASSLGLERSEPDPIRDAIRTLDRPLILDNAEQVADAVATLAADWLATCADLVLVITSRERLRIGVEHVIEVPPLASSAAIALFHHHAHAVASVDTDPAPELVGAIVERVDRLPLAVELAAARTRILSPAQLLDALGDTRRVLRSDRRDLPPRHRSMHEVVSSSWEALDPAGRAVLAQMSVLVDGFDLDTLEGVVDLGPDGPWPLDVVAGLRDRSLLQATEGFQGDARFHMLEVVRQFADAERRRLPAVTSAEDRVIDWFVARSGRWRAGIHQARPQAAIRAMARERRNLIALARHSLDRRPKASAQLVYNLGWHLLNQVPDPDTLELGVRAAEAAGDARLSIANALLFGRILEWTGRGDRALEVHQQALARARAEDPEQIPIACFHVTSHLGRRGDVDEAVTLCEEGLAAAEVHDKPIVAAMLAHRHGNVLSNGGRFVEARDPLERALDAYTILGQDAAVPYAELSLARNDAVLGDLEGARTRAEKVVARAEALSVTRLIGLARLDLGWILLASGRTEEAIPHIEGVAELITGLGDAGESARLTSARAACALARGEAFDTATLAAAAHALAADTTLGPHLMACALIHAHGGDFPIPSASHPDVAVVRAWAAWFASAEETLPASPEQPSWCDRVLRGIIEGRHG